MKTPSHLTPLNKGARSAVQPKALPLGLESRQGVGMADKPQLPAVQKPLHRRLLAPVGARAIYVRPLWKERLWTKFLGFIWGLYGILAPNRRVSNGDQVRLVAGLAMVRKSSVDFSGYWLRHKA